jgi:hypothetical protein
MNKILQPLFIAIAFAFAAAPAVSFAEGAVVVSESISAKATIVKVNKKTRELTLRDEQGHAKSPAQREGPEGQGCDRRGTG